MLTKKPGVVKIALTPSANEFRTWSSEPAKLSSGGARESSQQRDLNLGLRNRGEEALVLAFGRGNFFLLGDDVFFEGNGVTQFPAAFALEFCATFVWAADSFRAAVAIFTAESSPSLRDGFDSARGL